MKKLLSMLLALVLVFALVACGDSKPAETTAETKAETAAEAPATETAKGPIGVVSREAGSGTRGAFVEIVKVVGENGKDDATTKTAIIQDSTGKVKTTVIQDKSAIGYISLGSLDDTVKAVKVDGVEATDANVLDGSYKIARPFLVAYKDEASLSATAKDFLNYILSKTGQDIVKEHYITVDPNAPEYTKGEGVEGSLNISGSTSVTPLMEKLAEAYEKETGVKISINGSGSGQGIKDALAGSVDFGMSSRELKKDEKLEAKAIAKDGIAVIVNKENPAKDLTLDQIKGIFLGNTQNWEDVK